MQELIKAAAGGRQEASAASTILLESKSLATGEGQHTCFRGRDKSKTHLFWVRGKNLALLEHRQRSIASGEEKQKSSTPRGEAGNSGRKYWAEDSSKCLLYWGDGKNSCPLKPPTDKRWSLAIIGRRDRNMEKIRLLSLGQLKIEAEPG